MIIKFCIEFGLNPALTVVCLDLGEGEGEELMTLREECKQLKERLAARDEQRYSGHASDGLDSQAREAE